MKKRTAVTALLAAAVAGALWAAQRYLPEEESRREEASGGRAPQEETAEQESAGETPGQENAPAAAPEPVEIPAVTEKPEEPVFESLPISDEIFARMYGRSYKKNCTIPRGELRYLRLSHYGFDGEVHEGELVVNAAIADEVTAIFCELFEARYPIEKMRLIDDYDADDERSMADNNSSAFNYRTISGTDKLSNHSRGMAIDINPLYNPYVHANTGVEACEPANAQAYTDRTQDFPYKIDENDVCYQIFTAHGFSWGGSWSSSKDYQHFEY